MRKHVLVLVVAALVAMPAVPALAQSPRQPSSGDGGLHVCCGGAVGYVGGSGSISGNVVGPGGSSGSSVSGAPAAGGRPTALQGGVVTKASIPVPRQHLVGTTRASHSGSGALVWVVAATILVLAGALYGRRRPKLSP